MRVSKFTYVIIWNVCTFIVVDMVTGIAILAGLCAVIKRLGFKENRWI